MSTGARSATGSISWMDLTVPDAPAIRDFYAAVIGWKASEVPMGAYSDYTMTEPASGQAVAGICHARGVNSDLPPVWLLYITVSRLDESIERCRRLGGTVLTGPKSMGAYGRYCVIRDPAGAIAALGEPAP